MVRPKIYSMSFAKIYPLYVAKAERKGRTKSDVDKIIEWLTGYNLLGIEAQIEADSNLEDFFSESPQINPLRKNISGVVCGVRVEEIEDETTQNIRYLDKLIDELAKGKEMEKIIRK